MLEAQSPSADPAHRPRGVLEAAPSMNWKKLLTMWRWFLLLLPFVLLVWCFTLVVSFGRLESRVVVYVGAISRLNGIEEALLNLGRATEPLPPEGGGTAVRQGGGSAEEARARLREAYSELATFLGPTDPARTELLPLLTEAGALPATTEGVVDALEREAEGVGIGGSPGAGSLDRAAARVREAVRQCRRHLGEISVEMLHRWQSLSTLAMLACALALGAAMLFIVTYEREIVRARRAEAEIQAARKMEAIGRLAGGVAHDFNNLLMVIMGHAELLQSDLDDEDENAASHAEEISGAARRAAALTDQLLSFGRRQTLRPKELDLNVMILALARMLGRVIGEDIQLVTALAERAVWVVADPSHMEQVVMNLAINARDAMPRGGLLRIATANIELAAERVPQVRDLAPGSYARLTVSDDGIGMDEATLGRIFEPFFTTKGEGKGKGLGLATVYGIVQQAGGGIHVESRPGEGTTFEVYLPVARAALNPVAGPSPSGQEQVHTS
jgi:signal transduction histidine kinase